MFQRSLGKGCIAIISTSSGTWMQTSFGKIISTSCWPSFCGRGLGVAGTRLWKDDLLRFSLYGDEHVSGAPDYSGKATNSGGYVR
jgi:hypothetical protein